MKQLDDFVKLFRTHQQMHDVYQERYEKGLKHPVILEYSAGPQMLTFFGVSHSNDPNDYQWPILEKKWGKFEQHENPKKVVFYENSGASEAAKKTRPESLTQYSESGLVVWLATQAGISSKCGEPTREAEIEHLRKTYTTADLMTYYFSRQMLQWITQDFRVNPDWRDYAANTVRQYGSLDCWGEDTFDLERVLGWFKRTTGNEFDPEDKQQVYGLSTPAESKVSSASSQFRDRHLFEDLYEKWQDGFDVFAVYGSGHAIVLEPALKELIHER